MKFPGYGADDITQQVERKLCDVFEREVAVFEVTTGTAANSLSLAALTPPWGAIYCHPQSHIDNDECGAPEFFTHGAKIVGLGGKDGKLDPALLRQACSGQAGDVHVVQPASVSISQATESGHVYTVEEISTIGETCQSMGLRLHMDGARFANALVSLDCTPAEMTWKSGVDVLSFGATKNGAPGVEAIVLFDLSLANELALRRKRSGHLLSKMRLLSAQLGAYLTDDLWLKNARHANAMAKRLADGLARLPDVVLHAPPQANIVFCTLPQSVLEGLLQAGFEFYHDRWGPGVVRFVTSFASTSQDIDALLACAQQMTSDK